MRTPLVSLFLLAAVAASAKTYYAHPELGSADNAGTAQAPWPALEETIKAGKLKELQPGDELLLGSGFHGDVTFSGSNASPITIAAAPSNEPQLSRLTIGGGKNWIVRGLEISPSLGDKGYDGYIVSVGEQSEASGIVVEDCFVYTTLDTDGWSVDQWKNANGGMLQGRHGKNLNFKNNYVLNTRWGIVMAAFDSKAEGNVVSDFSGDGFRVTRDGCEVAYNVIKNIYVSDGDGDKNHDDAIQCFLFNKGTGTLRNLNIHHNLIYMREDDDQEWPAIFQGIGFFDGPLVDFKVTNNVIATEHWHGVSLFDAQGCLIEDNVVYNPWGGKFKPWVMLGSKLNQARGNTVKNNYAHSIRLGADKSVTESGNGTSSKRKWEDAAEDLLNEIHEGYGPEHPVAKRARIDL